MNCFSRAVFPIIFLLIISCPAPAQYILNGSAKQNSCNCYTLTTPDMTLSGSVWNSNKISLLNPFDFWFNVFLGCSDQGADGIVFMLQPLSTNVGTTGEGMGFSGVAPSIGIALDTYQNSNQNDPFYDHISIQANGNVNHNGDLSGPVPISSTTDNVEDCRWHQLRISWDPSTKWLRAYFDGVLRVQKQVDLVNTIFNGNPNVFWGFSGATGGQVNLQQFCTALNPDFITNAAINGGCAGTTTNFIDQSVSFAPIISYSWKFGDGQTSNVAQPPHIYQQPGNYNVSLHIKGLDGCENDTVKIITIGSIPAAQISVNDACLDHSPQIIFPSQNTGVTYDWKVDGISVSTDRIPVINNFTEGNHLMDVTVTSLFQCGPAAQASSAFTILPVPIISSSFLQSCSDVSFSSSQTDNSTTVNSWNWDYGDQHYENSQHPFHHFPYGDFTTKMWAIAANGCSSDTMVHMISTTAPVAFAGNDTVVIRNHDFQLHGSGNGNLLWTPATGLSDVSIANPIGNIDADQTYLLTVTTSQGCITTDQVKIRAMNGPAIYVPTAFTPNADGLNDLLLPTYVGIGKLKKFIVYNRWGQVMFSTSDMKKGWDGITNGSMQASGTYIWNITGENYLHEPITLKGFTTIIR
ncbi:MAG: lectin-like domain-containing protein [Flavisolibacter sp.]